MTQDNNQYSTLTVENLSAGNGNGGVIKMDVDGSAANTADRLYINGTHTGNHLISIDNTITETAVGTVLVSVGDEQGTFAAEKTEAHYIGMNMTLKTKQVPKAAIIPIGK